MSRRQLVITNQVGNALIALLSQEILYENTENAQLIEVFLSTPRIKFLYFALPGFFTLQYQSNGSVAIKPQVDLYQTKLPLESISFLLINSQLKNMILQNYFQFNSFQKDAFLPLNKAFGTYFRNENTQLPQLTENQLAQIQKTDCQPAHFVFLEELLYIQIQAMRQVINFGLQQNYQPIYSQIQTEEEILINNQQPLSPVAVLFYRFYQNKNYSYSTIGMETLLYLTQQNGLFRYLQNLVIHEGNLLNLQSFNPQILQILRKRKSLAVGQYDIVSFNVNIRIKFIQNLIKLFKPSYPLLCRFINMSFSSFKPKYEPLIKNNQHQRKLSWQTAQILFDIVNKISQNINFDKSLTQQELYDQQKIISFILPAFYNEIILATKNYMELDSQAIIDPQNYTIRLTMIIDFYKNMYKLTQQEIFEGYLRKAGNVIQDEFLPFSVQLKDDIENSILELNSLCINKQTTSFLTLVSDNILHVVKEGKQIVQYTQEDNLLVPYTDQHIIDEHYHVAALFHLKCQIITEKLSDLEINITSHLLDGFQTIDSIIEFLQVFIKVSYLFTSKPVILQLSRVFDNYLIFVVKFFDTIPTSINELEYQQTQICNIAKFINKLSINLLQSMLQLEENCYFIQISKDTQFQTLLTLAKLITQRFHEYLQEDLTLTSIKLHSICPHLNWFIIQFEQYLSKSTELKSNLIRLKEDYLKEKAIYFLEKINQSVFDVITQDLITFIDLNGLINYLIELDNFIIYSHQQQQQIELESYGNFGLYPPVNCFVPDIAISLKTQVQKFNIIYNYKQLTFIYKSRLNLQIDNLFQVAESSKFLTWTMNLQLKEFSNKSAFMLSNSLMSNQLFFEVIGECTEMIDQFYLENEFNQKDLEQYLQYDDDFLQLLKDTIIANKSFLMFPVESFDLELQNYFKIGCFCYDQGLKTQPPNLEKKSKNFRKVSSQLQNKEIFRIIEHTILKCKNYLNELICNIQNKIITSLSEINQDFYFQIVPDLQILVNKIRDLISCVQILQLGILFLFMSEKTYPLFQIDAFYDDSIHYSPDIMTTTQLIQLFSNIITNQEIDSQQNLVNKDVLHKLSQWLDIILDLQNYGYNIDLTKFKEQSDINVFSSPFTRILLWINSIMSSHSYLNTFINELQKQFQITLVVNSMDTVTNLIIPCLYNNCKYPISQIQIYLFIQIEKIFQQIFDQIQTTEQNIYIIDAKIVELKAIRYQVQDLFQIKSKLQNLLIEDYETIQNLIQLYDAIKDESVLKQFFSQFDVFLDYLNKFQYQVNNIHLGFTVLNSTKLLSYYQKIVYDIVQEAMSPVVAFIESVLNDSSAQLQKQIVQLEHVIEECTQQTSVDISNYNRVEKLIRSSFIMKCCIQTFILINQKCLDMNIFLTSSNVLIHTNIDQFQRELPVIKFKIDDINQRVDILVNNTRIQFIYHTHELFGQILTTQDQFMEKLIFNTFKEENFKDFYISDSEKIISKISSLIEIVDQKQLEQFRTSLLHIYELRYLQGQCECYDIQTEYYSLANISTFVTQQINKSTFISLQKTVQYKILSYQELILLIQLFQKLICKKVSYFYKSVDSFLYSAREAHNKIIYNIENIDNVQIKKQLYECIKVIDSLWSKITFFLSYKLFQKHHWIKVLITIQNKDQKQYQKIQNCIQIWQINDEPEIQQLMIIQIEQVSNISQIIQNAFEEDIFNKTISQITINYRQILESDKQVLLQQIIEHLSQFKQESLDISYIDTIGILKNLQEEFVQKRIQFHFNQAISLYKLQQVNDLNLQQLLNSLQYLQKLCIEHPYMDQLSEYRQIYYQFQSYILVFFLFGLLICKSFNNFQIVSFLSHSSLFDNLCLDISCIYQIGTQQDMNEVIKIFSGTSITIYQQILKLQYSEELVNDNIIVLNPIFSYIDDTQPNNYNEASQNVFKNDEEISEISAISLNEISQEDLQINQNEWAKKYSIIESLLLTVQLQDNILQNIVQFIKCNLQVANNVTNSAYYYSLNALLEKVRQIESLHLLKLMTTNSDIFPIVQKDILDLNFIKDFCQVFISNNLNKSKYSKILTILRKKANIKKYFQIQQNVENQNNNSLFLNFIQEMSINVLYPFIASTVISSYEVNTIIGFQTKSQVDENSLSTQTFVPLYRPINTQDMPEIPCIVFPFSINHPFLQIIVQLILLIEESIAIYTTQCIKKLRLMLHISTHGDSYYSPNLQNDYEFPLEIFQHSDQYNYPCTIYPSEVIQTAFYIVLDSSIVIPHEIYIEKEYTLQSSVQMGVLLISKLELFIQQIQEFISGFLSVQHKKKSFVIAMVSELPFAYEKANILYNIANQFLTKLKSILQNQQQNQHIRNMINYDANNYLYKQLKQPFVVIQHEILLSNDDTFQFLASSVLLQLQKTELNPEQLIILLQDGSISRISYVQQVYASREQYMQTDMLPFLSTFASKKLTESAQSLLIDFQVLQKINYLASKLSLLYQVQQFSHLREYALQIYHPKFKQLVPGAGDLLSIRQFSLPKYDFLNIKYLDQISFLILTQLKPQIFGGRSSVRSKTYTNNYTSTFISQARNNVVTNDVFGQPQCEYIVNIQNSSYSMSYSQTEDTQDQTQSVKTVQYKFHLVQREQGWDRLQCANNYDDQYSPFYDEVTKNIEDELIKDSVIVIDTLCVFVVLSSYQYAQCETDFYYDIVSSDFLQQQWCQSIINFLQGKLKLDQQFRFKVQVQELVTLLNKIPPLHLRIGIQNFYESFLSTSNITLQLSNYISEYSIIRYNIIINNISKYIYQILNRIVLLTAQRVQIHVINFNFHQLQLLDEIAILLKYCLQLYINEDVELSFINNIQSQIAKDSMKQYNLIVFNNINQQQISEQDIKLIKSQYQSTQMIILLVNQSKSIHYPLVDYQSTLQQFGLAQLLMINIIIHYQKWVNMKDIIQQEQELDYLDIFSEKFQGEKLEFKKQLSKNLLMTNYFYKYQKIIVNNTIIDIYIDVLLQIMVIIQDQAKLKYNDMLNLQLNVMNSIYSSFDAVLFQLHCHLNLKIIQVPHSFWLGLVIFFSYWQYKQLKIEMPQKAIMQSRNNRFLPSILTFKTVSESQQSNQDFNSWDIFLTQTVGLNLMFKIQSDLSINKFIPQLVIENKQIHHVFVELDSVELFDTYTHISDIISVLYMKIEQKYCTSKQQNTKFINKLLSNQIIHQHGIMKGVDIIILKLFIQKYHYNNYVEMGSKFQQSILIQKITSTQYIDNYIFNNNYIESSYNPFNMYHKNLIYIIQINDQNTVNLINQKQLNKNIFLTLEDSNLNQFLIPLYQNQQPLNQTQIVMKEIANHFKYEEINSIITYQKIKLDQISNYQALSTSLPQTLCFTLNVLFIAQNYFQCSFKKFLLKHQSFFNQILQHDSVNQLLQKHYSNLLNDNPQFQFIISTLFNKLEFSICKPIVQYPGNNGIPFQDDTYYQDSYQIINADTLVVSQHNIINLNKSFLSQYNANTLQLQKLIFFLDFYQHLQVYQNEIYLLDIVQDVTIITNSKFYVYQNQNFLDFYLGVCLKVVLLKQRCIILVQNLEIEGILQYLTEILQDGYSTSLITQCTADQEIMFLQQIKNLSNTYDLQFFSILDVLQYKFFENNSILDLIHIIIESNDQKSDNMIIDLHQDKIEESIFSDLYLTTQSQKLEEIHHYHQTILTHLRNTFTVTEQQLLYFQDIQNQVNQNIIDHEQRFKRTLPSYQDLQSVQDFEQQNIEYNNKIEQHNKLMDIQVKINNDINLELKQIQDQILLSEQYQQTLRHKLKQYRLNVRQINHYQFHVYKEISQITIQAIYLVITQDKKFSNVEKYMRRKFDNIDKLIRDITDSSVNIPKDCITILLSLIQVKDQMFNSNQDFNDQIEKLIFQSQLDEFLLKIVLNLLFLSQKTIEIEQNQLLIPPLQSRIRLNQLGQQKLNKKLDQIINEQNKIQLKIDFIKTNAENQITKNQQYTRILDEMHNISSQVKVITPNIYYQCQIVRNLNKELEFNSHLAAFLLYQQQYFSSQQQNLLEKSFGQDINIPQKFLPYILQNYFTKQQLISLYKMCSKYKVLNKNIIITKNDTQITQEKIVFLMQKHKTDAAFCDQLFNLFNAQINQLEEFLFENLINLLDNDIIFLILKQVFLSNSCILQTDNKQIAELIGSFMQYNTIMPFEYYTRINICTTSQDIQKLNFNRDYYQNDQNCVILIYNIEYSVVKPLLHSRHYGNIYRFDYKTGSIQDKESYIEFSSQVDIKILYVQQQDVNDKFINTYDIKVKKLKKDKNADYNSYQIHQSNSQTIKKYDETLDSYEQLQKQQQQLLQLIHKQNQNHSSINEINQGYQLYKDSLYATIINLIEYKKYIVGNVE